MTLPLPRLSPAFILFALSGCLDLAHFDSPTVSSVQSILDEKEPSGKLDVAIVLGCPAEEETGEPSLCERCRVKTAVRAYRDGQVGAILFTGGAAHNRFVEADVMAALAERRGVPESAIEREPEALTTWMNLRLSQRIMRRKNWRTALIVSTAAHLPRAKRFADWFRIPARYRACDLEPHESDERTWIELQ